MYGDASLTFQEFVMQEPLPIATIQRAVFEFLQGRKDVVLFGAQAVNAYVAEPRMSQDVVLMAVDAETLAEEIREFLGTQFHIAVRVRKVKEGLGYRVYQLRKPENRHLVDVRKVDSLPDSRSVNGIQVLSPELVIAGKVNASWQRRHHPRSDTDRRDIRYMLLAFPEFKEKPEVITRLLTVAGADEAVLNSWKELASEQLVETEDGDF